MACVILADPPWKFLTRSVKGKGRSAEAWYDCMTLADIKALPVAQMAAPDSLLLLWTTRTYLEQAFGVIAAWGSVYKTIAFTWVKTTKDGKGFPMGMGYHTRANPELCLLAARGKGVQRLRRDVRELIISPRRKHSQKPNEAYDRIERLWPGPCLELSPVITGRAGNRWATKSTAARSCSGAGRRTATRSPHRKAVEIRRLPDGGSIGRKRRRRRCASSPAYPNPTTPLWAAASSVTTARPSNRCGNPIGKRGRPLSIASAIAILNCGRAMAERDPDAPTLKRQGLYPCEAEIAHRLSQSEKHWRRIAPQLERQGLPKIDPIMKGRFWPAVEAFFRNRHGLGDMVASQPDGEERWDVA
jgi:N6-adenosine-specific RNA methylase IME4